MIQLSTQTPDHKSTIGILLDVMDVDLSAFIGVDARYGNCLMVDNISNCLVIEFLSQINL